MRPTQLGHLKQGRPDQRRLGLRSFDDRENVVVVDRSLRNPSINRFDCSCFDGVYVTGDVSPEYLAGISTGRSDGESSSSRLSSYQLDLGLQRID